MNVLRISHSGVVAEWRERERALRRLGVAVTLVTAEGWDEGGQTVTFEVGEDSFATAARTWGNHPNLFVFDPRPLWRLLGSKWDVLDLHEEPCSFAAAEILGLRWLRRQRAPFVLYSAQNIYKRYPVPFRWSERWALHRAAAVSVCNAAAGRILRRKGLRGQVAEIPLGVDLDRYAPTERKAPGAGALKVGYVGRLADHKGVDVLLRSVASRPEWSLELLGGGPAEGPLRQLAEDLDLGKRVSFVGPVGHEELPARYGTMDLVVVPSVPTPSWDEQFCRVAVEAMASGVPVIASRTGALPEVIGEAGLLVEPGDPESLQAALDKLAADPSLWTDLRNRGLERAARFSWDEVAAAYLDLYEDIAP